MGILHFLNAKGSANWDFGRVWSQHHPLVSWYPMVSLNFDSDFDSGGIWGGLASGNQRWQVGNHVYSTLWLFNIAMENDPFIDDVPIKIVISIAMLNDQKVNISSIFFYTRKVQARFLSVLLSSCSIIWILFTLRNSSILF